ncbi:hypothetical protein MDOR_37680 [Mycolicibacterium doricum]|uniref:Arabinofuranosyltransferase central domain-containing protein n=1 Tax=Mycolicibacterium doricum TaxID=126673 RepID=A0A1X1T491_9MYCO|nr:arabinosyltransferase domain-containing protein [Mycolicibacterium doricum]MCV7267691.1 arabinosyltransferase domain-containing protein [Mycolicibacterium doricum]ORV39357.1 hypothetical protein AWC01_00310 [Mycolicibacterium doricum]BBZ09599.1 hypothetical protein MDOR_37680 [Mycolicibacterium doricum]
MKLAAIILCIAAAVLTLVIAHRLDRFDGRRARWALPRRWRRVSLLDAVVIGVLLLWHVVGANTADDACQLGMARVSEQAGYMVNYFRYFGVPEHRLGQGITNVFGRFIQISTASIWVRIPALLLAAATWWLISCEVLPRIGTSSGRELIGFPAVLLGSGVRSVLAPVWPVLDNTDTVDFVVGLHRCMRAGVAPATALSQAIGEVCNAGVPAAVWGVFAAYGQ